jgi:hypothetical protein
MWKRAYMFVVVVGMVGRGAWGKDLPVTETAVGRLAGVVLPGSVVVSGDGGRLAYAVKEGEVTLEDRGVFLDKEGRKEAPAAQVRMVIDNRFQPVFDALTPVVFSPDSKRVAYGGQKGGKWTIFVDGKAVDGEGDETPAVAAVFSGDSAHVGTVLRKDYKWYVTVDGKTWPVIEGTGAGMLTFSPEGKHAAAVARVKAGPAWVLFVDGKAAAVPSGGKGLDRFAAYAWRPDGGAVAYQAGFGGPPRKGWQVFTTEGWSSGEYEGLMKGAPVWSADGKRVVFGAMRKDKAMTNWLVVTKEGASGALEQVRPETVGFLETEAGGKVIYVGQVGKEWRVFVENAAVAGVGGFEGIVGGSFVMSRDGKHYAFAGARGGKTVVVRDGEEVATVDEAGAGTFGFSEDGEHLGFAGRLGTGAEAWHVVVDEKMGAGYAGIGPTAVAFSPEGRRAATTVMVAGAGGRGQWKLVAGEYASKGYDAMLKGGKVVWRDEGHVVTVAIQKTVALRVEGKVGE